MSRLRGSLPVLTLILAAVAMLALGGIASGTSKPPQATRADLAAGEPSFAPGYRLSLMRVVIPAGVKLAPHRHPGMQTARVISGRLAYRVFRGAVTVYSGPADGTEKAVRTIRAGHAAVIEAGQWIVENPGVWHAGSNPGKKPTVILVAALLKASAPISIPVET
jgi:quercetin dioxygenase-like cupin family protein